MENTEWKSVLFNGLETNLEVTKCGRVRKVPKDWYGKGSGSCKVKYGEVDFSKLKPHTYGYQQVNIKAKGLESRCVQLHQLVAAAFLGYKFEGLKSVVDHIDSNPLNNNVDNLRVVTQRVNASKERTLKRGLPVGVYYWKITNRYYSKIYINNKSIFLGYYDTPEEASQAYQNELKTIL